MTHPRLTTHPRLFHFSEDPRIEVFAPRTVRQPARRKPGQEWLNGPLVWAVDEIRQATYLFPRDCPRIVLWVTAETSGADRALWWGERNCSMIAHVERRWLARIGDASIYRYELPADSFEATDDPWMWVSAQPVVPVGMTTYRDLFDAQRRQGVELRVLESLVPLKDVWSTSLQTSGIRLRHAEGWPHD
jgi:hypothetical protein